MSQAVLSYHEFVAYIRENLEDRLEGEARSVVHMSEVTKNNGVAYDGLTIHQGGEECVPIYYLRDLYARYLKGEAADGLVAWIIRDYSRNRSGSFDSEWFERLDHLRDKIILKAVNYEWNREQLQDCPFRKELDLALTYRILLEQQPGRMGTVLVNNEMMQSWGVTEAELYQIAVDNVQRLWPLTLEPLQAVLASLLLETDEETEILPDTPDIPPADLDIQMYVLSNTARLNGAAVLFYTDVIREFAERFQGDIYILPSSVHEILLLPVTDDITAWEYKEIVAEVNEQHLLTEEILSSHVYKYLCGENRMIIAA